MKAAMMTAMLIAAISCLYGCVGSAQARQLKQYMAYIPQQGSQVQVTASSGASTSVHMQTPQPSHQGSQVQSLIPLAQQAVSTFSQQSLSNDQQQLSPSTAYKTSSNNHRRRDDASEVEPQDTLVAKGGDGINDPVLQEVLELHNNFRARHQVGSLSWSSKLQASAQDWANRWVQSRACGSDSTADRCVFQHSGPGENLAQYFPNFSAAFKGWVDEEAQYAWDGQFSYATGHFTQISWKSTTQLGCGYAPSCSLYVCHYDPPGNVIGQFNENVFRPAS